MVTILINVLYMTCHKRYFLASTTIGNDSLYCIHIPPSIIDSLPQTEQIFNVYIAKRNASSFTFGLVGFVNTVISS